MRRWLLGAALLASAAMLRAEESLDALWRDACLWEVGSNLEKVPAARKKLIEAGDKALAYIIPDKMDVSDTIVTRAISMVVAGIAEKDRKGAVDRLLPCLDSKSSAVRRNAADVLGQIGAIEAAPGIAKLLTDKDARLGALHALAALKAQSTTPEIAALARSDILERHRVEATATLGALGGADAQAALLELLADKAAPVRFAAQFALEAMKPVDELLKRLSDGDLRVRLHAIAALGHIGDGKARDGLLPLLDDPLPEVRGFAAEALLPMLAAGDREMILKRRNAETHPFPRGKLEAALEKIDRAPEAGK